MRRPTFPGTNGAYGRADRSCADRIVRSWTEGADIGAHPHPRRGVADRGDDGRIEASVELARGFVETAASIEAASSSRDRRRRQRLRTLVRDPAAAEFTVQLTDEVPRIRVPRRGAERFAELVRSAELSSFSRADRALLRLGARVAPVMPRLVMPIVLRRLRSESAAVILSAEDRAFAAHLARRRSEGIRCNINVLGEAIIGDDEARRRLDTVLARLARDDVDYVSVKISAICPAINVLAFDETVARVSGRLRLLFGEAARFDPPKFVNLDMEEYRDLDLTIAAFRAVLDEPEFEHLDAGIVLQAYLPDARAAARDLAEWAAARHGRAGGRTKVRIVKGANLAMELVEAELAGWAPVPYGSKAEVDANFKSVLDLLAEKEYDAAVRIGVASHNLFDVAWALQLRAEMISDGRPDRLEIEMLEGMAPSQSAVVRAAAGDLLLYAPVVARRDFPAAIAYLVRRLDENTAADNFLSHLFDLADDRALFDAEADRFRTAVRARHSVDATPRRRQDRSQPPMAVSVDEPFENAPDTDWTLRVNREWLSAALGSHDATLAAIEHDAGVESVDRALRTSVAARTGWAAMATDERTAILNRIGDVFETDRGRILAVMAREAGKTIPQGDPEVSEGVDFARYYARDALRLGSVRGAVAEPLGTVVVAPPWNFPFAIPAGGVLAALAGANTVVLKPAPQTVGTAALVAEACWEAGVPRDVLQFLPVPDGDVGRRLITHPDVDAVILTGASATASMFHEWRPDLRLHAETSGKNAIVVTATADVDRAVADLVHSAFGHAGQKCSAASLAIVEAPLYDDPAFLERVRDAAATLRVGTPDDLASDIGPLIEPPGPTLERALTSLDPGEDWLLEPEARSADGRLWSPGIRLGVRPGAWFAHTECFGPVLGIIRADDLDHAIAIQNGTEFGLTAGLQALDPTEIDRWLDQVEAGNLYVNRGITGAIVRRQPFGGWKRSAVGPAAKAGGPNYVASLCRWRRDPATTIDRAGVGFEAWMREVGVVEHDPTGLVGERNTFRYRPLPGGVLVRFGSSATAHDRALVELAARATGCAVTVSDAADEAPADLVARVAELDVDRLRSIGAATDDREDVVRRACHAAGIAIDDDPPTGAAEIELPRWMREQAVSITTHRHGRVSPPSPPTAPQ